MPLPPRVFYGWWIVLGGAIGSGVLAGVYVIGFSAVYVALIPEFGVSRAVLAGAVSLSQLESGFMGPIQGWLVDRFGPRKMMLIGMAIMGGGLILLSRTGGIVTFYIVFVLGVGVWASIGFGSTVFTTIAHWFYRKRSLAYGIALSGVGVGSALVPLMTLLINHFGWRGASVLAGFFIWVTCIPVALLLRHRPEQYGMLPDGGPPPAASAAMARETSEQDYTVREAMKTSAFWLMSLAHAARALLYSAIQLHLISALVDRGYSSQFAATVVTAYGFVSIAGRFGSGWLGDRLDKRLFLTGLTALMTASVFLMVGPIALWQIVAFLALFSPGQGGSAVMMFSIRADYFGRKAYGAIQGTMNSVQVLGVMAGPFLTGLIYDMTGSYSYAFVILGCAGVVSSALTFLAHKPVKLRTAPATAEPTTPG